MEGKSGNKFLIDTVLVLTDFVGLLLLGLKS